MSYVPFRTGGIPICRSILYNIKCSHDIFYAVGLLVSHYPHRKVKVTVFWTSSQENKLCGDALVLRLGSSITVNVSPKTEVGVSVATFIV